MNTKIWWTFSSFKFEGWNQDNISSITGIRTADLPWRQQAKHQNEDLVIVFHSLTEGKVRGCQRSWRQENRQLQVQDYHSYSRMLTSLDHMLSQQHFLSTLKTFWLFEELIFKREINDCLICRDPWCQRFRQSAKTIFNDPSGTKTRKKDIVASHK